VTFLAYFHYNNKGIFPFSDECKDQELKNLAELDDTTLAFVRDTRRHAMEHSELAPSPRSPPGASSRGARRATLTGGPPVAENAWQQLWDGDDYENDYYFISQLFEPNWQPRTMA